MTEDRIIITEPAKPHHFTCVVHELLPVFSQPEVVDIIFHCWRKLRDNHGMLLYGYVVMEEHLHFLAQAERIDICFSDFQEQTAGRIINLLEERRLDRFLSCFPLYDGVRENRFWQENAEVETITGLEMVRKTLDYIHINPVKRGYVDCAEQWRYSSARIYAGESGEHDIDLWDGDVLT